MLVFKPGLYRWKQAHFTSGGLRHAAITALDQLQAFGSSPHPPDREAGWQDFLAAAASLQRGEKIHRLHDWQKRGLVIFHVARHQAIEPGLHGRDHLDRIFKVVVIEMERLLNRALIHRGDF